MPTCLPPPPPACSPRGKVLPKQWCTAEQLRLNFPPHKAPNNQRLRLACQVTALPGSSLYCLQCSCQQCLLLLPSAPNNSCVL